jgi:chromosome segregation ATPase
MKTYRTCVLLVFAITLLTASRGRADDKDDVQKILNEVGELRRAAEKDRQDALKTVRETKDLVDSFKALAAEMTKEAQARAEETRTLQKALDESRLALFKMQEQTNELKQKLASAETELQTARKNNADLDKREPRKINIVEEPRLPETQEKIQDKEIHGKITGIADAGLYVVSVGSDEGLKPALVMEVYKADDKTKRIGVITVVRSYTKQAVGQFKPDGKERAELGDEVMVRIAPK